MTTESSSETTILPIYSAENGDSITINSRCSNENTTVNESSCSTTNDTVLGDMDKKISVKIDYVGYVAIPVFLLLGLSGNTLTIIVMLSKHFRKMSVSIILVALAFSDTTLIILLPFNKGFVREILGVDIRALSSIGCKLFFLIFRSAKMTSSWFVVFLCLERFVAVWFPLKTRFICTKRNACIGLMIVYGFLFSFNGAWTFASRLANGACIPHYPEPAYLSAIFIVLGTIIYSILPICLLMILTPLICYKLFQRIKVQKALSSGNQNISEEVRKTTTMLIGVSIAYIVLVSPIAIAHLVFYNQGLNIFESTEPTMVIYREVAQILEQLNYSINFFMYVLCSKSFRDRVKLVLTCQEETNSRHRSQYSTKTSTIRAKKEVCAEKSSSGISSVDGNLSDCAEIKNSKPPVDDDP
ncbi:hypothetical protein SNE40_011505 [Patella caerulea]|uniref:G-protein coupled receptors family 1 profile domain-containing protein n=1 Tax=Patella caerulea TaxID=87958 RepID=A0AAN8JQ18_PATCE